MEDQYLKRIARLTAILTRLQTTQLLTAPQLAKTFDVSIRTIYRDIKTLDQAGIPILTEAGRGYTLMEGYKLPPVAFTASEASALVTAQKFIAKSKNGALIREYDSALSKVKAVLDYFTKEDIELLSNRIAVSRTPSTADQGHHYMPPIQNAITTFKVIEIQYLSGNHKKKTLRKIEPFALYYSLEEHWLLIAYCRLRKEFRMFRLDRIQSLVAMELNFAPHKMTLESFLDAKKKKFSTPDIPLS